MSSPAMKPDRRSFLKTSLAGATGLLVGLHLPENALAEQAPVPAGGFAPNAWIRVAPDDTVTLVIDRSEMGQGVITSLSMLLAEELECDWKRVRWEFAPADKAYFSPIFGMQGTGGSMSLRGAWTPTLKAGAVARDMLVTAAAQQWGVDKALCRAENGVVTNTRTNARATYGSLAGAAAKLPVPGDVPLKDPKTFKLVGKPTPRLDTAIKTTGRAQFGIDVRLPGMLHAVVARCPVFGGKLASFDATRAKACSRREGGRADLERSGRRRRQHLERDPGPRAARRQVGRRPEREPQHRRHHPDVRRQDGGARRRSPQGGRRRRGPGRRPEEARSRLRSPLPRPRHHGADELHRRRALRPGGGVGADPDADDDRSERGEDLRAQAGAGPRPHHVPGHRLRPPRRAGLRGRGPRGLQGRWCSRAGDLDPRGRHAARLLSPRVVLPVLRRPGRGGLARGLDRADRLTLHHGALLRARGDQGRPGRRAPSKACPTSPTTFPTCWSTTT